MDASRQPGLEPVTGAADAVTSAEVIASFASRTLVLQGRWEISTWRHQETVAAKKAADSSLAIGPRMGAARRAYDEVN
jgi:hypothetical protein